MTPPPVDRRLVERLEPVMAAFSVARLEELAGLPGNPLELRIERFGGAVAPVSRAAPELDFVNRIEALGRADAHRLDEIVSFYRSVGARPWLEFGPHLTAVGASLAAAGAEVVGFQSVLYGEPSTGLEPVVAVAETDDAETAARVALEGNGVPVDVAIAHAPALAAAVDRLRGRFYLVEIDDRPAAVAVLTAEDGVAYLALAATLPEFRRRGCQQALIAARLGHAAEAGYELVATTTEFGSQSQRNLERSGLRVAYTKPVLRLTLP